MKNIKVIALILLIFFVGIQFVPTVRNQSESTPKTDFMMVNRVPKNINEKLQLSCYDCHSNNTSYPWYNKVQPVAWFLESHIKKGKADLNFSEWGDYSDRRKKSKLKSIISQIKDDNMPLSSYKLIHKKAGFSEEEKKEVMTWLTDLKVNL